MPVGLAFVTSLILSSLHAEEYRHSSIRRGRGRRGVCGKFPAVVVVEEVDVEIEVVVVGRGGGVVG